MQRPSRCVTLAPVKALVLEDGELAVREVPVPARNPGEALIRVTMAGICNTDLEIAKGYMGFSGVLGHELCGVIETCELSTFEYASVVFRSGVQLLKIWPDQTSSVRSWS